MRGDHGRASLATAERYSLTGEPRLAMLSAQAAMAGIPTGTPDWIRAQDIVMVSRAAVEQQDRRGNRRRASDTRSAAPAVSAHRH
jgi:predicted Zn-dependent protease